MFPMPSYTVLLITRVSVRLPSASLISIVPAMMLPSASYSAFKTVSLSSLRSYVVNFFGVSNNPNVSRPAISITGAIPKLLLLI